jgi:hypothetical protein
MPPIQSAMLFVASLLMLSSPALAEDNKEYKKWTYRGGRGEIYGQGSYSARTSWPRGILTLENLARDDVEVLSLTEKQSLLKVISTQDCLMVWHYGTRGEDDATGVYAVEFGKGGQRLLFDTKQMLQAPSGIRFLSQFPSLTSLELGDVELNAEELVYLNDCPSLTTLSIGSNSINDSVVAKLSKLQNLYTLEIQRGKLSTESFRLLSEMPNLHLLSLNDMTIPQGALKQLQFAPWLNSLDLSGSKFDPNELRSLRDCPQLKTLMLNRTAMNDQNVALLTDLFLTKVTLFDTQLTSAGLKRFLKDKPGFLQLSMELKFTGDTNAYSQSQIKMRDLIGPTPVMSRVDYVKTHSKELDAFMKGRKWQANSVSHGLESREIKTSIPTDQPFPAAPFPRESFREIVIQQGAIANDDELRMLGSLQLANYFARVHLDLSNSKVTGRGFRNWSDEQISTLDLSNSALDDEGLRTVSRTGFGVMGKRTSAPVVFVPGWA